jgi:predicted aminopeptidase
MTLEDLRPDLTDTLAEQQRYRRFQDWFEHELGKAKIAVDHAYGKWSSKYTRVT